MYLYTTNLARIIMFYRMSFPIGLPNTYTHTSRPQLNRTQHISSGPQQRCCHFVSSSVVGSPIWSKHRWVRERMIGILHLSYHWIDWGWICRIDFVNWCLQWYIDYPSKSWIYAFPLLSNCNCDWNSRPIFEMLSCGPIHWPHQVSIHDSMQMLIPTILSRSTTLLEKKRAEYSAKQSSIVHQKQ